MSIDTDKILRKGYEIEYKKLLAIRELFIDTFGKENVDDEIPSYRSFKDKNKGLIDRVNLFSALNFHLKESKIRPSKYVFYVHFPSVHITNERNESIDIRDLWVRLYIDNNGRLVEVFKMVVTTYDMTLLNSGYRHSHLPRLRNILDDINNFYKPCFGNGPIINTQYNLMREYNYDIWGLFMTELSLYVKTESLAGGPYIKMSEVNNYKQGINLLKRTYKSPLYITSVSKALGGDEFIRYLIDKYDFIFSFYDGTYHIGMSDNDIIIMVSNAFKEYMKERLKREDSQDYLTSLYDDNILIKAGLHNGLISLKTDKNITQDTIDRAKKIYVLTFKGKKIHINITDDLHEYSDVTILNPVIVENLMLKLLMLVNYGTNIDTTEETIFLI